MSAIVCCFSDAAKRSDGFEVLKEQAVNAGICVVATVSKKCTHFIVAPAENVARPSAKLRAAIAREDVSVVSVAFVEEFVKMGKKPDEALFLAFKEEVRVNEEEQLEQPRGNERKRRRKEPVSYVEEEEDENEPLEESTSRTRPNQGSKGHSKSSSESVKEEKTPTLRKEIRKGRCVADPHFPYAQSCHVYQDKDCVYDAMLNQTNISSNNNKYFLIQVLQEDSGSQYYTWFRWGRVGYNGQTAIGYKGTDLSDAISVFKKKFLDKTKNNWEDRESEYDLIARDYGDDADDDEAINACEKTSVPHSQLDARVQRLIQLIFNTDMMKASMVEIGYDAEKMPLGKLTKQHIQKGYEALKQIADIVNNARSKDRAKLVELCSRFYTIIPHNFGMRPPEIISTPQQLKQKLQMVEALAEIELATTLLKSGKADEITHNPLDVHYQSLKCEINPMDKDDSTWSLINDYLRNTHAPTHSNYSLEIIDIYQINRQGETDRFIGPKLKNCKLLWHGSRLTNFVGILSQGLRIAPPEAPSTGYMYILLPNQDMVSKSANYCCTSPRHPTGLLLLCEVALGDECLMTEADYNAAQVVAKQKKNSTKGCGQTFPDPSGEVVLPDGTVVPMGKPISRGDRKSLLYNEFIVYDVKQVRIKYLVQVKFNYGKGNY